MARSFWSKRKDNLQTTASHVKNTNSVSRPTALLLTLVGILIVGGLLFGVFTGTRWIIAKVSEEDVATTATTSTTTTQPPSSTNTQPTQTNPAPVGGPSVTATSSTTTTTPSTPAATTTQPLSANTSLPNTGPGNYLGVFIAVALLGYLAHYARTLRKN